MTEAPADGTMPHAPGDSADAQTKRPIAALLLSTFKLRRILFFEFPPPQITSNTVYRP
jgi:hypothetical protein